MNFSGAWGFEPHLTVLETVVLPLTLCPCKIHVFSRSRKSNPAKRDRFYCERPLCSAQGRQVQLTYRPISLFNLQDGLNLYMVFQNKILQLRDHCAPRVAYTYL